MCVLPTGIRKGGHNIPESDVTRRFSKRIKSLGQIIPLCDNIIFYDNENGFVKVGEITNNKFSYTNDYRPQWLVSVKDELIP